MGFQLVDILWDVDQYEGNHDEQTVIITPDQSENEEIRMVDVEKDV